MGKHESVVLAPTAGVSVLNTKPDIRQWIHNVTMAAVPVLVLLGHWSETNVLYWVGLALGVVDAILIAMPNTQDKVRKIIYAVAGLTQAVLFSVGILTQVEAATIVGAVVTFLTSSLATFYTPTSTLEPVNEAPSLEADTA
jgi:hypothetical protein